MKWEDITMGQYNALQKVLTKHYRRPEAKTFELAKVVFKKDIQREPITSLQWYYNELSELFNTPVPEGRAKRKYTLGVDEYELRLEIESMTTAQYMDLTEYAKNVQLNLTKIISVFLIPVGKMYNDGYNIADVCSAIDQYMNAVEGNAIAFFMLNRCKTYMRRLASCSIHLIIRTKVVPRKERLKAALNLGIGWLNMERLIM